MKSEKDNKVQVKPIKQAIIVVEIEGVTPLLMEKPDEHLETLMSEYWSKSSAEGKKIKKPRDTRSAEEIIEAKIYYNDNKEVIFPSSGFIGGMVRVAIDKNYFVGTELRRAVRPLQPFSVIKFKEKTVSNIWGRIKRKTPRMLSRPQFNGWSTSLTIGFDPEFISPEELLNLLNEAGFNSGLGGYRPGLGGSFGMYRVTKVIK